MELRPINPRSKLELSPDEAAPPLGVETGRALKKATEKEEKRISALQRVFYADARHALLIVLQGRDASGKDGTICKVFGAVNPLSFLALLLVVSASAETNSRPSA